MTKKGLAGFSKTQASCCPIKQVCPQAMLKLCNRRNSVTGYAISTSAGSPVFFFDLFDIPAILPESDWAQRLSGRASLLPFLWCGDLSGDPRAGGAETSIHRQGRYLKQDVMVVFTTQDLMLHVQLLAHYLTLSMCWKFSSVAPVKR